MQFTLVFTFSISFIYFIILCDEELVQFTLVGGGCQWSVRPGRKSSQERHWVGEREGGLEGWRGGGWRGGGSGVPGYFSALCEHFIGAPPPMQIALILHHTK